MIVGNSIIKHIDGWRLNKRIGSTVSVRSTPGAKIKAMLHHAKGCLEFTSHDHIILYYGIYDLRSNNIPQKSSNKILNLGTSRKTNENQVFISGLVVRNDKLNKQGTEVYELLMSKIGTRHIY